MAISSAGIGSGLDVNSIVTQLAALERRPIEGLQTAATFMQTQISAFGKVQSLVNTLADSARAMAKPTLWQQNTASSSEASVLAATAGADATPGLYSVDIERVAKAQVLASGSFTAGETLGTGQLVIDIGSWDAGPPAAFTSNSSVTLEFTESPTLQQVRDRINAAGAGVSAAIVNDASGARLSITSKATGTTNSVRIQALDEQGAPLASGLSRLAYANDGNPAALGEVQASVDARVKINGLAVESASNRISGAIEGLELNVQKTGSATLTVAGDSGSQRKAVQDFVSAFNALNAFLAEQTSYNESTKTGGTLQGDSAAVSLRNQMRSLLQATGGTSDTFARLSEVGLELQRDGSIKVNTAKLDAGLAKPAEMEKLLTTVDIASPGRSGLALRFQKFGEALVGTDGTLSTRTSGLQSRLKRNQGDQERIEERVKRTTERLYKQYQALDTRVAQLNGLSTLVTQQLAMLNSQFNNRDK